MAKVRQGILGGFRGRIGNVVGTGWKGIAVMKSLPLTVANPRTAGQVLQRGKFSTLVNIASVILAGIIKPLWDRFASGMSGYNAFISANQGAFSPAGVLIADQMQISRGRMIAPSVTIATTSGKNLTATIANPVGDRYALPTDKIYALLLDAADNRPLFAGQVTQSRGSSATVNITAEMLEVPDGGHSLCLFVSYLRSDGSEVSNSASYNL